MHIHAGTRINRFLLYALPVYTCSENTCRQHRQSESTTASAVASLCSTSCSDADVLSTSLTSTNGSCPCAAVPHQAAVLARGSPLAPSQHGLTHLDTCTHTQYPHGRAVCSDMTVFSNRIHLDSELRTACKQSPCSRPEINM